MGRKIDRSYLETPAHYCGFSLGGYGRGFDNGYCRGHWAKPETHSPKCPVRQEAECPKTPSETT